jgi:hypothetical protein
MSAPMLQRPIFGGVFGDGRYSLATMPAIANGLHAVTFMVIDPREGAVLSVGEDKMRALAGARRLLGVCAPTSAYVEPPWRQGQLFPSSETPTPTLKRKRISRRRRAIFWRGEGRCHYCRTKLDINGPFHCEHMVPLALGGDDQPLNLVPSCPSCNSRKGPRTALEMFRDEGGAR